jgi:uncharacterized membrane protein HdeD (DUF308 family)
MPVAEATRRRWMLCLVLVFVAVAVSVLVSAPPRRPEPLLGGGLIAVGVYYVLDHRRLGRQSSKWSTALSRALKFRVGAVLWDWLGEKGAEQLFLGIGLICLVGGAVLLV